MQNLAKAHKAIAEFNQLLGREIKKESKLFEECFIELRVKKSDLMFMTCYANFKGYKSTLRFESVLNNHSHKSENLDKAFAVKMAGYIRKALNETN